MIRQYLMVYNYHVGINNDRLIKLLNKDFRDTSDSSSVPQDESLAEKCE